MHNKTGEKLQKRQEVHKTLQHQATTKNQRETFDGDSNIRTTSRYTDYYKDNCHTSRYDNCQTCNDFDCHTHKMEGVTISTSKAKTQANANGTKGKTWPKGPKPMNRSKSMGNNRDPRKVGFTKDADNTTTNQSGIISCTRCTGLMPMREDM